MWGEGFPGHRIGPTFICEILGFLRRGCAAQKSLKPVRHVVLPLRTATAIG